MEFKSSIFIMLKNVLYGIFGGGFIGFILTYFIDDIKIALGIGLAVGLLIIYFALFGDNIRVTVDENFLRVYKRKKLKHEFDRRKVDLYAKVRTVDGDSDCHLTVTDADGSSTMLDCSMLGRSRFYKLLDALEVTDAPPIAVKTTKKN